MRQVNIKELSKHLSVEMSDLPFAVTKRGKIIGVMVALGTTQGTDLTLEDIIPEPKSIRKIKNSVHDKNEAVKKLTEIIQKKQGTDIQETDIATDGRPVFGYPKSYQARKKGS